MKIKKKLAAYLEDSFFYRLRKIGFEKNDEDGANGSYHRVTGDLIHGIALDFINLERILAYLYRCPEAYGALINLMQGNIGLDTVI